MNREKRHIISSKQNILIRTGLLEPELNLGLEESSSIGLEFLNATGSFSGALDHWRLLEQNFSGDIMLPKEPFERARIQEGRNCSLVELEHRIEP